MTKLIEAIVSSTPRLRSTPYLVDLLEARPSDLARCHMIAVVGIEVRLRYAEAGALLAHACL